VEDGKQNCGREVKIVDEGKENCGRAK